jgi:hypothetical protein
VGQLTTKTRWTAPEPEPKYGDAMSAPIAVADAPE